MYPVAYQTLSHDVGTASSQPQKLISALELHQAREKQAKENSKKQNGSTIIAGRYEMNTATPQEGHLVPCIDLKTGYPCTGQLYPLGRFNKSAPLLMASIEGILQPLDTCLVGNDSILVIRPATFGDLHGYLKHNKKLSEVQASLYFQQVVNIIDQAHRRGIVLRDIKLKKFHFTDPQMLTLALSDLEDATVIGTNGYSNDLLNDRHGCPAYVAPEMLKLGPYSGRAADMWSSGIILYTLLVGHYPFFDVDPQILFTKIRSGYYAVPPTISYLARSLISSLLSYDPSHRPKASSIANHPWLSKPSSNEGLPLSLKQDDQTVPICIHKLL